MKISTVITVAALAFGGAAYAQDGGNGPGQHSMPNDTAVSTAPHHAKGDGLIAKTKRGFHRMGAKMRHAFHRDHTSAMGASSADDNDAGRQRRMDAAYENWKAKHAR